MRRQNGITLLGMLIVLTVLGAFTYFGMRIFPMYTEYQNVTSALESVAREPGSRTFSPAVTYNKLQLKFITFYVNDIKQENISYDQKAGNKVTIAWERRAPLFHKIWVLGDFSESVTMTN